MNALRRKRLNDFIKVVEMIKEELESIKDEEQEYFDGIPDNLQSGERYEASESAIDNMDSAVSSLEEVISSIEEITNN
jgi:hypothetical protein